MIKIIKSFSYLSVLATSRDPRAGIDHWGTVKVPDTPISRNYSAEE